MLQETCRLHASGTTERGSAALKQSMDAVLEVSADDAGLMKLECAKTKNTAAFDPVYLARLPHAESCVLVPSDRASQASASSKPTPRQLDILERLNLSIYQDYGAKKGALNADFDGKYSSTNVGNILNVLRQKEYVRQGKGGDPYFITDIGKEALRTYRPHL